MIRLNNKNIIAINMNGKSILSVYLRGQKIWPDILDIILSCYYNGYWIDEYSWTDDTSWTD